MASRSGVAVEHDYHHRHRVFEKESTRRLGLRQALLCTTSLVQVLRNSELRQEHTLRLMRDVVRYGTGAGISAFGVEGEFDGKTGTTDDGRDAWFVGFNPDFLGLSWVGFDNNRPLRLGGSTLALPIWAQIARQAGLDGDRRWEAPAGIVEAEVDTTTGQLATGRCPDTITEIFIDGTQPPECESHHGGFDSWVTRLVNWFRRD